MILSRRALFGATSGLAAAALLRPLSAVAAVVPAISPTLLRRGLAALDQHGSAIPNRDVMAIADFALPSRSPRFHVVDIANGRVSSYLVAHGRGSDPGHTGWLQRFSNAPQSHATSAGTYRTEDIYVGSHGRSIRLSGLDPSNNNALPRAIVVHGAWYVSDAMVHAHGVLGRSEGCFALAPTSLPEILDRLGSGRLIYAGKI
jgi:hypothetical protein